LIITRVHIRGFRNFVDETIELDEKTLIIGGNDSGKSNLLYALRILFDPALCSHDLELGPSDFNIQSNAHLIEITARLEDIHEPCLNSALREAIKDGVSYIRYSLQKGGEYQFAIGRSPETIRDCNGRPYIKNLVLEYVSSNRDLGAFLKRQQNRLLEISRDQLSDELIAQDAQSIGGIQKGLEELNNSISSLNYVSKSLAPINEEMSNLSIGNEGYSARLVAGNTDANRLLDNLQMAYLRGDTPLVFGGDGRGNQLYFATWMSEQRLIDKPEKIVLFAIEEPEAHLHPHQQRRLAEYLSTSMKGQVLLTTHSPQIVERFRQGRILRLVGPDAANGSQAMGCNVDIDNAMSKLGYRLNPISSEVFFSSGALLVEGPSERIFYTALAYALDKDLDRLNISVLSVDGVGFTPYVRVCKELGIPYALRTDNDVFGRGKECRKRLAGVQRLADIAEKFVGDIELTSLIVEYHEQLTWDDTDDIPQATQEASSKLASALERHGLFLSEVDLETDLVNGPLQHQLKDYFQTDTLERTISAMQQHKAENMYGFITTNPDLCDLADGAIAKPLNYIVNKAKGSID
jgi:putative ATP-dependent endonuclease of OLD family